MDETPPSLMIRLCAPVRPRGAGTDEAAWARFVDLYTPLLYAWACRLEPQEADALDLVQDVFLLLHQKLPEFRYDSRQSFRGWLRTVLHNKWRDRHRAARPATNAAELVAERAVPDPLDDFTEADYRRHLVRRALELMRTDFEPSSWNAFWQTAIEGRPAAAVAAELNLSLAAVYKATSRVRKRLQEELEGLL